MAEYGYCQCGCGQKTSLNTLNNATNGYVKGEPKKFVVGHQRIGVYGTQRKPNNWEAEGDYAVVLIPRKGQMMRCKVDLCNLDKVLSLTWSYVADGYAVHMKKRSGKYSRIYMHRFLLGDDLPNLPVDHINRDKLDNRISNLRLVSVSENCRNVERRSNTGLRGAHMRLRQDRSPRFYAVIHLNGATKHLGSFETAEAAHAVTMQFLRKHKLIPDSQLPEVALSTDIHR